MGAPTTRPDRSKGSSGGWASRRSCEILIDNGHSTGRPATAEDVLTVDEVAALFKLSPRTVSEYGARGLLPSVKIGRHRRFSRRQLEVLMGGDHEPGAGR